MAFIPPKDRVLELSTSNSQTIFAVAGSGVDTSYNAFSAHMSVGDTTIGAVVEPGVAFKSGVLTYSATNQITIDSTGFESKGTFSSGGTKEVFMGLPAAGAANLKRPNSFTDGTDATSSTAAGNKFSGGVAVAKKLFVGDSTSISGTLNIIGGPTGNNVGQLMLYFPGENDIGARSYANSDIGIIAQYSGQNFPSTNQYGRILDILAAGGNTGSVMRLMTQGASAGASVAVTISTAQAIRFNAYGAGTLTTDSSGNITASSDETIKVIHGPFERGLEDLRDILPILYSYSADSGMETETVYAGFSAQNVRANIPEAIGEMANGKLTLQDRPILAALVNAVIGMADRIDTLEAQLAVRTSRLT